MHIGEELAKKECINFAWPVTSVNREDYLAFNRWFEGNRDNILQGKVAIWGAGIRGTEFSILFKRNDFYNLFFVDNNEQKWGGVVDEFPIISTDEFFGMTEKERIKIVISTENCVDIKRQLESKGYIQNEDFYIIESNLYQKYVDEFLRKYKNNVLVMGDCEFSKISLKDSDLSDLDEMLKEKCGDDKVKVLAMHGMGLRSYYNILIAQIDRNMQPKALLVMVNLDTLTGIQHLLPRSQHEELLQKIYDITPQKRDEFSEYMQCVRERSRNIQAEFSTKGNSGTDKNLEEVKAKNYFRLNYMYKLDENIEGLQYLRKIIELAKEKGIVCIPFVPPVNYQLAERLFGEKFRVRYEDNMEIIRKIAKEKQVQLLDMSYSLNGEMFAYPNTPDETANEAGRKKIAELLYKTISRFMD